MRRILNALVILGVIFAFYYYYKGKFKSMDKKDVISTQEQSSEDLYKRAVELQKMAEKSLYETEKELFKTELNKISLLVYNAKYREALELAEKLIKEHKNNPEAYFERGKIYMRTRDFAKAEKDFKRAFELGKKDSEYYASMSDLSLNLGNIEKSFEYIEKALKLDPYDRSLIYKRAVIYEKKKDYKNAIKDYEFLYNSENNETVKSLLKKELEILKNKLK